MATSDEEQALPSQLLPEQVSDDAFLEHALAAGLAGGSPNAGQQTDFSRLRLFGMKQPPATAHRLYGRAFWQRYRWQILQAAENPAALPGVVPFIVQCLADRVGESLNAAEMRETSRFTLHIWRMETKSCGAV